MQSQIVGHNWVTFTYHLCQHQCWFLVPRMTWVSQPSIHPCSVSQLCPILCDPMDCSPPDSFIHGIFQARILESCHFLLQGILLIQGLNPYLLCLLHWQEGSLPLIPPAKPRTYALFINKSQAQTSSQVKSLDHNHISAWTQTPCFGLLAVLSLRARLASLAHSMQIHACCPPLTAHLEARACFASKNIRVFSAVFLSSKIRASNIWNKRGNRTKSVRR